MTLLVLGLTYIERKVIARMQLRLGPTRSGPAGLLQPVADALKLLTKEDLRPALADSWVFQLAPYAIFVPTFMAFVAVPYAPRLGHSIAVARPVLHPGGHVGIDRRLGHGRLGI